MSEIPDLQQIDLRALIGHKTAVQAEGRLEDVYQSFERYNIAFIAVLENERVIGMCSRWQIGMLLGSRYGFSLFSRKPVRDHLLPDALVVSIQSPIAEGLEEAASRSEEAFYDDVLLVNEQDSFLGMIFTRTLMQLQHRFLRENIERLEEKQREINSKNEQMHEELRMASEYNWRCCLNDIQLFRPTLPTNPVRCASLTDITRQARLAGTSSPYTALR